MKKISAFLAWTVVAIAELLVSFKNSSLQIVRVGQSDVMRKSVTMYAAGHAADLQATNGQVLLKVKQAEVGKTNFEGKQLPKDTSLLITAIRVRFDADDADVETLAFANNIPPQFANGEFKIIQNGTGTLFTASGSDVSNRGAATGNDDDFREIVPVLIRSQKDFDFVFSTVGAPYTGSYKIELRGEMYTAPTSN